jgi:hypothetical protein
MLRPMLTTTSKALRLALLAAVLVAPLLASGRAHAGVTIVMQRGNEPTTTVYVDNDKMRADNPKSTHEGSIIMDGAAKKTIMINEAEKSYMEVTQADLERFAAMMTQVRAQSAERMKSMPPEQRKKMEAMMGGGKPIDIKFEKMGGKKTINGFSCEMYRKLEDGKATEEDCIAPWSASLIQKSDFAGLKKFAEEVAKTAGMMGRGGQDMFSQFEKSPGFPVSRHILEGEGLGPNERALRGQVTPQEDEVLKSIKRGSIPASTFAVPAGYTKKELPMGPMGGPHHGPGGRPMMPQQP